MDNNIPALLTRRLESIEKLDHSWFFGFDTGVTIATESLWRLIHNGRIAVTSDDHGHPFGLPAPVDAVQRVQPVLSGRYVTYASIHQITGDLTVDFDDASRLQFFQTSFGYESWRLNAPDGSQSICLGGGEIAYFPAWKATDAPNGDSTAQL